ncbi:hypothetical protein ACLBXM_20275 [Xanthobacteraceae bacterium A53D]
MSMPRLIAILIVSQLPVAVALMLFGIMQANALSPHAFPQPEALVVQHLELGLIRSR